jgi:LysM repeat protein
MGMYPLELLLFMDHLRARPKHRSRLPRRLRRLISTVWISAAVALPVVSMVLISSDALVAPVSGQVVHQVVNGETLATIARRYDVSVDELVQANGLSNPDQVYVGQELSIPGAAVQIHTVQIGESLALIAERYGVSTESILVANSLSGLNDITAGQQLTIPGAETPEDSTGEVTYVVKRGDSLYRIAWCSGCRSTRCWPPTGCRVPMQSIPAWCCGFRPPIRSRRKPTSRSPTPSGPVKP